MMKNASGFCHYLWFCCSYKRYLQQIHPGEKDSNCVKLLQCRLFQRNSAQHNKTTMFTSSQFRDNQPNYGSFLLCPTAVEEILKSGCVWVSECCFACISVNLESTEQIQGVCQSSLFSGENTSRLGLLSELTRSYTFFLSLPTRSLSMFPSLRLVMKPFKRKLLSRWITKWQR